MKIISRDAALAAGALALLAASPAWAQSAAAPTAPAKPTAPVPQAYPVTGITISLPANPDASSMKDEPDQAGSCAAPAAGEGQETRAAISTSRSNIKRPGMTASAVPPPPGPASAAINTSRSNIKRPGLAVTAPVHGEACEASAMQDVSTTR